VLREHPACRSASNLQADTLVTHFDNIRPKDGNGKKANNNKAVNDGHGQESILQ
jgi:hypothetical protein